MHEPSVCNSCGNSLPPGDPGPACAACLATVAVAGDTSPAVPETTIALPARTLTPTLDDLRACFPQLEVLELIGQGGMGAVYRARQVGLDRLVALKILPRSVNGGSEFEDRFWREAKVLARINHPHVVAVYDFGVAGDYCFLLMEYVEGMNLRQTLRHAHLQCYGPSGEIQPAIHDGRMAPGVAVYLALQMCEALEHAHERQVVHRDIKPENLLLNSSAQIKVADFGLAKLLEQDGQYVNLTHSSQALGTLRYMAPEQWERPQDADERADVYSFGVVLYELLTGRLPVGRFASPSETPGVDPRLDAIVFGMLEREPERRIATIADVRRALLELHAAPPQLAPAFRYLTGRSWLTGLLAIGAAWIAALLAWNLGLAGALLGVAALGVGFHLAARRFLVDLPPARKEFAAQGRLEPWRWIAAHVAFQAACWLLLLTTLLGNDSNAVRLGDRMQPLNDEAFEARYRDLEDPLFASAPFEEAAHRRGAADGVTTPAGEIRLTMSRRRVGSPVHYWSWQGQLAGLLLSYALFAAAVGIVVGFRPFWSRCLPPTTVVWLPVWLLAFFVVNPPVRKETMSIDAGVPIPTQSYVATEDAVRERLIAWAAREDFELLGGGEWSIHRPRRLTEELGLVSTFYARKKSLFDRWRLRPGKFERRSPDLLILLAGARDPDSTFARIMPIDFKPVEGHSVGGEALAQALLAKLDPARDAAPEKAIAESK